MNPDNAQGGKMLEGKKVVLAYSGGLDTSVCLKWLEQRGATPYALYLDLGQGEPAEDVRNKAIDIGASDAFVRDAKAEFAEEYVAPAIKANALYGGKYPLFTALGRPLIARKLVEAAREVGATHIAHGSTGKGNDQVRFDVTTASIAPDLTVVAPVRDWNMSRPQEIEYAREHGVPVPVTKESPYSVDANLWGRSIEAGPLEDPDHEPTEDVFELTASPENAPDEPRYVEIGFEEGLPTSLDGEELPLVELIAELNRVAGKHGVGRVDMIEDRLVGIKSREIYEAPAALGIVQAHRELETLTLTKDVLRFKSTVEQRYAELTYDGLWFTPLKTALDAFIEATQKTVTGTVRLKLYKGSSTVAGRTAPQALYNKDLATYDPNSTFDETAAAGFIALWGLPARQWAGVNGSIERDPSSIKSKLQG
jgi:argininosuccinate synthase